MEIKKSFNNISYKKFISEVKNIFDNGNFIYSSEDYFRIFNLMGIDAHEDNRNDNYREIINYRNNEFYRDYNRFYEDKNHTYYIVASYNKQNKSGYFMLINENIKGE